MQILLYSIFQPSSNFFPSQALDTALKVIRVLVVLIEYKKGMNLSIGREFIKISGGHNIFNIKPMELRSHN